MPVWITLNNEKTKLPLSCFQSCGFSLPDACLEHLKRLQAGSNHSLLRQGMILSLMKEKGWCAGRKDFGKMCDLDLGMAHQEVAYLLSIGTWLRETSVSLDHIEQLGMPKLLLLLQHLAASEVNEIWIQTATTVSPWELRRALIAARHGEDGCPDKLKKTFWLYDYQAEFLDQTLRIFNKADGTCFDHEALISLCVSGTSGPIKELSIAMITSILRAKGVEVAGEVFAMAFPDKGIPISK